MNSLRYDRRIELLLFGMQPDADLSQIAGVTDRIDHRDGTKGLIFGLQISRNEIWGKAIEALIDKLGGETRVSMLLDTLRPRRRIMSIWYPANSPYQENNGFHAASIGLLARLCLELDVGVLDFDPTNASHFNDGYDDHTVS